MKDKDLTFQVSGKLWNRSLVMSDVETGSLWSHILGEAMSGPMKGTTLELLAGEMTTWEDWKKRQPQTQVLNLSRTADEFDADIYRRARDYVFGVAQLGKAKAWGMQFLSENPVYHDEFFGEPVVVVYDENSTRIGVFHRTLEGQILNFEKALFDGYLVEFETGVLMDSLSGEFTEGPMSGKQLKPLLGILSFKKAWETFHPDGEVVR